MKESKLMEGKSGLVTGGGSGIGRASAIAFAKEGAQVIVSDIDEKSGKETVRLIKNFGGTAAFFKCDVSKEEEIKALVDYVVLEFGRLDWAHNNAGISSDINLLADIPNDNWERVLKTNLDGTYFALKYEIKKMLENGGGSIVNTSSMSGLGGRSKMAPYSASKWGVNSLTKTAAIDYGNQNIRVNAVCPGMTYTSGVKAWAESAPDLYKNVLKTIPLGRMGTPEEIANVAVFLCSEKASFITGITMVVDGGRSAE